MRKLFIFIFALLLLQTFGHAGIVRHGAKGFKKAALETKHVKKPASKVAKAFFKVVY